MVTTAPRTCPAGRVHERMATPSMCTVQAPHWAMPQPYLVPVRPTTSRITHSRGISGGTSTSCIAPLIFNLIAISYVLPLVLWQPFSQGSPTLRLANAAGTSSSILDEIITGQPEAKGELQIAGSPN